MDQYPDHIKSAPSSDYDRVRQGIKQGFGVGLKTQHYAEIIKSKPPLEFFEVHAENYMGAGGAPHAYLERIAQDYPISVHGVGLSIGGEKPLNELHLQRLKGVVERYQPVLFSEHLAWSSHEPIYYNDLLPLPYTEATLARVVEHIDEVQNVVGRQMLLENPSTYVLFSESTMSETVFLREVAKRSGCGLLLDVNNIFVSCSNSGTDAHSYVDAFPLEFVGEVHLGGHTPDEDEYGNPLLIDSHDREVIDPVWHLYGYAIARMGLRPTLIEWDNDVPEFAKLMGEAVLAQKMCETSLADATR
ncbi:DUF692 domain-containing protein [Polycladidibacter hongkongensis]|uniref:MNIO family bufferin maturase n=1 Tax=Polycladidibacter hongkongensis TaxID=1647556 RepID=UPI0009E71AC8|nr:DUF692 domain-containing protein [Pseudovibrio hongkongensis]